jgi:hypothetical protein
MNETICAPSDFMHTNSIPLSLNLRAGELVTVRSKEEILATLDGSGCLDGLPFMPEMFQFCGRCLRVYKRAHKTCDTINNSGGRSVTNAVHLEGVRCDGQAHGGCQAECLIFWKEAWLRRVSGSPTGDAVSPANAHTPCPTAARGSCTEQNVLTSVCKPRREMSDEPVYVCQATRLLEASSPLSPWDLKQYWEDFVSGNFKLKWMLGVFFYAAYNSLMPFGRGWGGRKLLRGIYNMAQRFRGRPLYPRTRGRIPLGGRTPTEDLNLQAGELVRVKSFDKILDTIDWDYYNRGLRWDAEMVPHCGRIYRVRKRVKRIIHEKTGKMLQLKSEPIMLEGATCRSMYSNCRYFCPRSIYSYWREIWLERVADRKSADSWAASHSRTAEMADLKVKR